MAQPNRPESITGGCLCGAVRFTISFPNESDWPPKTNFVCQCTMCRKHTGSLFPQLIHIPSSNISPPLTSSSQPTFKTYDSSPSGERGFCSTCGSTLTFQSKKSDSIELNIGAIDEEVLIGKKDEANAWEDKHGKHVPRIGGWGYKLAYPQSHIFTENEVPGVTDGFEGVKYLTNSRSGESYKGKARNLPKK